MSFPQIIELGDYTITIEYKPRSAQIPNGYRPPLYQMASIISTNFQINTQTVIGHSRTSSAVKARYTFIVEARKSGWSALEIAKFLDVDISTISYALNKEKTL